MSEKGKRFDKLAERLQTIPIIKKLEIDKVLKFLKLLYLRPLMGATLFATGVFAIDYRYGSNSPLALDLMKVFGVIFIGTLLTISIFEYRTAMWQGKIAIYREEFQLIKDVTLSQEGMRTEWLMGWRDILKLKYSSLQSLRSTINKSIVHTADQKENLYHLINMEMDKVQEEYEKLLSFTYNSMKEFQLGMEKPVPEVEMEAIKQIEGMIATMNEKLNL